MRSWLKLGGLGALALGLSLACSSNNSDKSDDDDDNDDSNQSGGSGNVVANGGKGGGNATGGTGSGTDSCANFEGLPADCGTMGSAAKKVAVNTLLVVDKSGSMANNFTGSGSTKWAALRTALEAAITNTQDVMRYGLEMYPAADVAKDCIDAACCKVYAGSSVDVGVDLGSDVLNPILTALQKAVPGGGTPTAAALREAGAYFTTGPGRNLEGRKVVLLATDGGPNCNSGYPGCEVDQCTYNIDEQGNCSPVTANCCLPANYGPIGCIDDIDVISAVQTLQANGINTIVLGMPGTSNYEAVLNQMAQAGGMARATNPQYYAVDSVDGLTQTIKDITIQLVTQCEVPLEAVVPNKDSVNVAVDCKLLRPEGSTSGTAQWTYTESPPSITILGSACEQMQAPGGGARRVDVLLGCPTVQ